MGIFSSRDDEEDGGASWYVYSDSDPRWNGGGRCGHSIWLIEVACQEHVEKMKKKLGKPPKDLTIGGMKD